MRKLILIASMAVAGCVTTPAGLLETNVEETVISTKTPRAFATCLAENFSDATLRDDGERYWVLVEVFGVPRFRYDFSATETGSIAEVRSTAVGGGATKELKKCAS